MLFVSKKLNKFRKCIVMMRDFYTWNVNESSLDMKLRWFHCRTVIISLTSFDGLAGIEGNMTDAKRGH